MEKIKNIVDKIKNNVKTELPKDTEWKSFKLNEIFSNPETGRETINASDIGDVNLISSREGNNGVAKKIDTGRKLFDGNKLTLSKNGSVGIVYYQKENFYATSDILVLSNKFLNENIGLFLKVVIEQYTKKFDWGNKINSEKYNNIIIFLPSKNNKPDWEYMDNFISKLKKEMKLEIVERERELY